MWDHVDGAYGYPTDPINKVDLDGNPAWEIALTVASFIPGPIGAAASIALAAVEISRSNYGGAALAVRLLGPVAKTAALVYRASRVARVAKSGGDLMKVFPVTNLTARVAGRMYVGKGAKMIRNGNWNDGLVSADGLRRFRTPAPKVKYRGKQANFELRSRAVNNSRAWKYPNRTYNGHLRVGNRMLGG